MSSIGPRAQAASELLPLLGHAQDTAIAAWRGASPVTVRELLDDVARAAAALPAASHILNLCADRYHFAVAYLAAIARGQVTLLPPGPTPNVIAGLRAFAPDVYFVSDDPALVADLPRCDLAQAPAVPPWPAMPHVRADQLVAILFTSGSTGEPQPHFKTWGSMVRDVRAEALRFGIGDGHSVLGTVPPQHMFGFESTVMLPLAIGAALTDERPYYPGDIDTAIARLPAPRVLFTTPFHLRAWLGADDPVGIEMIVSATAPLSLELARETEARTGARLLEIYGCTEAGQVATRRPTETSDWQLYPGLKMREHEGRAVVLGAHVEEPIALQDVIEAHADGVHFTLHGRFSDMVNIAGKRNSLAYLNHQLTSIEGVLDGVFFVPDEREPDAVTRLTAFVVAPALTVGQVLEQLRARIDPAFLPRPLVKVDSLPRQITGKLPREALRALAARRDEPSPKGS
jgi:acyl-coenzyme A synthetase/AMP-(fatty) acid ligase